HHEDKPRMPPKGKLKDDQIAALTVWIRQGAVWPNSDLKVRETIVEKSTFTITDKDRAFWSFQPIVDPPLPAVKSTGWPKNPIDYFALAQWEARDLHPVEPADQRTLIRRVTFDLIGLPPSVEEVDAFLQDRSPDAFARVVDR